MSAGKVTGLNGLVGAVLGKDQGATVVSSRLSAAIVSSESAFWRALAADDRISNLVDGFRLAFAQFIERFAR
jgi:hypothetical protein